MTLEDRTRQEHSKVNAFIRDWQKENPYQDNLKEHNLKFKDAFTEFLGTSGLTEEVINFYKF